MHLCLAANGYIALDSDMFGVSSAGTSYPKDRK